MLLSSENKNRIDPKFILRMVHDLRTPLNAIKGLLYLAREEMESPKKIEERLTIMESIIDYLQGIVEDALDFNQIEDESLILKQQEFSLFNLIESVRAIILPLTKDKGQMFETIELDLTEEYLIGDAIRIRQVLINLLSNSVKYTGVGGCINLQIKQIKQNETTVIMEFQILDSGIGMSRDFLDRMFLPYEKEEPKDYPEQKGTGLGLYITNNLVRMMGGSIKANSKPNIGSVLTVKIPFDISDRTFQADEPDKIRETIWGSSDFSGRRVLVAEDDPDSLDIMAELLSKTGLTVDKATDGIEAIRLFSASPPKHYDAILMDMIMPQMDGMEAAGKIRNLDHPDGRRIAIISITGDNREEAGLDSKDSVIDAFVLKPINYRTLYQLLDQMFHRSNGVKVCHKHYMKQLYEENQ